MNFEEFLTPEQKAADIKETETTEIPETEPEENSDGVELDVQKAVVEALAAEKAEQEEHISSLRKTIVDLRSRLALAETQLALKTEALGQVGDTLAKNAEEEKLSNKISLLDRSSELPDRFRGESRDIVLEVIKEAREIAEREGRVRRAQILESVLMANESEGTLAKRREELINLFSQNGNILSGPVLEELQKLGIPHKKGEEYLLPAEIIKRTY